MNTLIVPVGDKEMLIDEDMLSLYRSRKWYLSADGRAVSIRKRYGRGLKTTQFHRLVLKTEFEVDHINRNCLDNRRINLRECSRSNNAFNRIKAVNKTCNYKGVYWAKTQQCWIAQIKIDGKSTHLYAAKDCIDAAFCYDVAAKLLSPAFAYINQVVILEPKHTQLTSLIINKISRVRKAYNLL